MSNIMRFGGGDSLEGAMETIGIGSTTTKDYKIIACSRFVVGKRNGASAGNVWVEGEYEGSAQQIGLGFWGYCGALSKDLDSYCYTTFYFNVKAGAVIRNSGGSNGEVKQGCWGFE